MGKIGSLAFTEALRLIGKIDSEREILMLVSALRTKGQAIQERAFEAIHALISGDKTPEPAANKLKSGDKRLTPKFRAHLRRIAKVRSERARIRKEQERLKKMKGAS